MKALSSGFLAFSTWLLMCANAQSATGAANLTGRWEVTTNYPGGSFVAGLDLAVTGRAFKGRSGYLVPDGYWYKYSGTLENNGLHLKILGPDGKTAIGSLVLTLHGATLSGNGVIHDVPVTVSATRPLQRPANAPRVHDFIPQVYYTTFSGGHPPALHIFPGDTVRTKTVDCCGNGENAAQHTLPGNPQTGPFYIEGAMLGDTIAVHFNKIRPNRDTAEQYHATLNPHVLPPGYSQEPSADWSSVWKLDRERGTATSVATSDKLKNFSVKLVPMLGCVAVAPYWKQAIGTGDMGPFGGNMDYNGVREGVTLYLPVYQAGAMLTVGDGHAQQGDGEITGQGLETSMDVEFTVDLIPNQLLDQPWAENDEYIMVSGIGGSLDAALQIATAGLSNWLKSYYRLNASEIATVLAASIRYEIASAAGSQAHIVAKIRKDVLSQLPKPPSPASMFCQPSWGCMVD